VFRTIATNGDAEHWASSNLNMTELERVATAEKTWAIENYHCDIKQFCGEMSGSFCNRPAQSHCNGFAGFPALRNL
jgi:hypothetical protein